MSQTTVYPLVPALASCPTPMDQDVVEGVLKGLFSSVFPSDLDPDAQATKIKEGGLCRVALLERIDDAKLKDIGLSVAAAMFVGIAIRATVAAQAVSAPAAPMMALPPSSPAVSSRKEQLREFPELAPSGYPARSSFDMWWLALVAVADHECGRDAKAALQAKEVPAGWTQGGNQDRVLHRVLVN